MTAGRARRRSDAEPASPEVEALRAEIAALRAEMAQLEQLADRDVLTPLLNRRAFLRELNRAIAFCQRYQAQACLLYLDLDGFKAVNDVRGHAEGDRLLVTVAKALQQAVRADDAVGRFGGDEFLVLAQRSEEHTSELQSH